MAKQVLSATALALLLSVSAFSIDAATAQTSDTPSATKKSLDDKHLTPIRPIRRVGDDSWPSANNRPATRETTGQSPKEEKQDTAQNDTKSDAPKSDAPKSDPAKSDPAKSDVAKSDVAKSETKPNPNLGNQSPPPDKPLDAAKKDNKQNRDQKNDTGFASIRLGTDSSGRVAINESQEKQLSAVMRKHHAETFDVKVSVGSVAPANVRFGAVSSDFIDIFPQFRGYSYFTTREDIVVVEPSTRKVVALIPVKTTATASRSHEERTTAASGDERTQTRPASRTRTVVKERDVTVGSGVPTEAEILAAPVARGVPAGTTVTRTYRSYDYVPDDDVVVIERRRPRFFPFW
jgi:hypothetical protein